MNDPNTPPPDTNCPLCDGSGEVEINPNGNMNDGNFYGCPLCMSKGHADAMAEKDATIARLRDALVRSYIDVLRRVRKSQLNTDPR
jgi:hypothetical protein